MYRIKVEQYFESAHSLRGYKGKCEALHGHRYRAVVIISAKKLNDIGLAYDFTDIKKHMREIVARFDHFNLNEVPPFDKINPSAENIAATIFNEVKPKLAGTLVSLESVEVWESPEQGATYIPD